MKRPTLRRRRLAAALHKIREDAGLTLAQAAEGAGFSTSKLSRVESLQIGITGDDTRTFCEALGVNEQVTAALAELARQGRRRGWWHVYSDDVLGKFVDFIELETDARSVGEFESDVIPGILQTEAYAEAIMRHGLPEADEEIIKQRCALRMERQDRLEDADLTFWTVIDEAILRRPLGGHATMVDQLDRLLRIAARPRMTVQVMPMDVSGHAALGVPFTLIELRDGTSYVYLDSLTGGAFMEEDVDVRAYRAAWSRLQAMALDFDRSTRLIRSIAAEHRSNADGEPH
ncbi:MAG: helix-turn-helix domain-containing protein [Sciscionella sp.]